MSVSVPLSILFFTKYSRKGASSRYRTLQYIPYLERNGVACTISPLFDDDYLEFRYRHGRVSMSAVVRAFLRRIWTLATCKKFDVLVIEKELFPYMPALATKMLSWMNVQYIVDYDDALFHQYDNHKFNLVSRLLGSKILRVMRGAAVVIAGNNYLAGYAKAAGSRNVRLVPTVVDLELYSEPELHRDKEDVFTIGWIGSPTTSVYLEAIASALAEVCAGGKARVQLVGSGPCTLTGVPVDIVSWDEETEIEKLNNFDVGIMPLPNEPWERGKCGLKLIQYMACGLPVVASPVGVNTEIVQERKNGFLAEDHDAWVRALTVLRDSPETCNKMGSAGRIDVEKHYSLQRWAPELLTVLNSVPSLSTPHG